MDLTYPTSKVRGGGWEELPHIQGVIAVQVQEGREELLHFQGHLGPPWEDTIVQVKEQWLRFAGAAMKLKDAYSSEGNLDSLKTPWTV